MEYLLELKNSRFWMDGEEYDLPEQFTNESQKEEIKNWLTENHDFSEYSDYIEFGGNE